MKVTVVCVGKLKEKYWRDAIAEYSKRLSRYMKLEIIELADEKAPENMSDAQAAEVKEREGQRILKNVKDDAFAVALAVEGKMLSREYEKDGVKYTAWEVTATEIELLTPKKDGNGQDTKSAPSTTQQAAKESDDLPF